MPENSKKKAGNGRNGRNGPATPKQEPFPWKVYRNPEPRGNPFSVRIGWWDSWHMAYVILGRKRSQKGKASRKWSEIGFMSRSGDVYFESGQTRSEFVESLGKELSSEAVEYNERSKKWLDGGGSLRELNREMAMENGTLERSR